MYSSCITSTLVAYFIDIFVFSILSVCCPHDLVNFLDHHVLILMILYSCGTKVAWAGPLLVMWILILTFIFLSIMKLCTLLYLFLCMNALPLKMLCLGRTGYKFFFWGHVCSELGYMIGLFIIIWCWIQWLSF